MRHLRQTVSVEKKWYGNDYGGFYVCPEFITGDAVIYSFGIGEDISFDKMLIDSHGCRVFGFDPTPKSIDWVRSQGRDLSPNFQFFSYGIGEKTGPADFSLPMNTEHVSGSYVMQKNVNENRRIRVELKSFPDIAKELGHGRIDVLKMDIEGAEYSVIQSILESSVRIDQVLIEFHDRLMQDGTRKSIEAVDRLRRHGFEIFGVSSTFEEISFINRRLLKSAIFDD